MCSPAASRSRRSPCRRISATTYAPVAGCCSQFGTTIEDHPMPPGQRLMVTGNIVLPGLFPDDAHPAALRPRFHRCRRRERAEGRDHQRDFAKRFWPAGDALGHLIDTGNGMATIVGVVGDIKQGRLVDAPEPQFYRPYAQDPWTHGRRGADADVKRRSSRADVRRVARDSTRWRCRSRAFHDPAGDRRLDRVEASARPLLAVFAFVALRWRRSASTRS